MQTTITVKPGLEGTTIFDFAISIPWIGCVIETVLWKAGSEGKLRDITPIVMSPLVITLSSVAEKAEKALQKMIKLLERDPLTSELVVKVERQSAQ